MKTAIVIYGYRAVGKTTLINALLPHLPGYRSFSIDEYRKKYNTDNSTDGEREAGWHHDDDYDRADKKIAESGGSRWLVMRYMAERSKTIFIYMECQKSIREMRIHKRESTPGWTPTPWPFPDTKSEQLRIERFMENNFSLIEPDLQLDSTRSTEDLVSQVIEYFKRMDG